MNILSSKTKEIMKKYNIYPNKRFGQNFLIDEKVLSSIVEAGEITDNDLVIEIGPGLGVLTRELCKKAGKVLAIEIDKKFVELLNQELKEFDNFQVVKDDVLKLDIDKMIDSVNWNGEVKVVANLPYYITTPVIMKLLEETTGIKSITVMVQKEVAERITAKPGGKDYGALTVSTFYYGLARKLFDVPPHCFIPQPGVVSSVIRIDLTESPPVKITNKENFFKVVRASFSHRRKTILNCLAGSGLFKATKDELAGILGNIGIDEKRRPETLSIDEFEKIAKIMGM